MIEQKISFEVSKLAKEKGFISGWIDVFMSHYNEDGQLTNRPGEEIYEAPTQSFLQKWIRETHNLDVIIASNLIGYAYLIYQRYPPKNFTNKNVYQTYEEALEEGLLESLQLIK